MNKNPKKFLITTLGCKVNQADSATLKKLLVEAGFELDEKDPDVVVVNTCAVTKNAIRKDRRMLNGLKTKHPEAKFVLMGCFPQTHKKEAEEFDVDLVWGTGKLNKLEEKIGELFDVRTYVRTSVRTLIESPKAGERSRYFLKIQDGCEQFCSYCIIPYSRGKLCSRPEQEIFNEIKAAIKAGFSEIVLCGIHLGLYGKEKNSKTCDLSSLLEKIVKITGLGRVRLSSIEANDITGQLLAVMAREGRVCNHLHIPLQSGTDKILQAMNRPYNTEYFENVATKARKAMPDIAITTDLIVGFPTETKKDFIRTKKFIEKINFSKLHVFPFSAHEKTPAAKMEGQVPHQEKTQRATELRKLNLKLEGKYKEKFIGEKVEFVVERIENGTIRGKEEHYFDVEVEAENERVLIGSLYKTTMC